MSRIYYDKKTEAAIRAVLRLYGIEPRPKQDSSGRFYEWSVPDYWKHLRRDRFTQAIELAQVQ